MEIISTFPFLKSAKPLAKKYKSFNEDYKELIKELTANPWEESLSAPLKNFWLSIFRL